ILEFHGIRNIREATEEINFSCPFPEHKFGDRNPSSFINKKTGQYQCFSCGRHGSLISFIAEYEEISYSEAQSNLAVSKTLYKSKKLSDALRSALNKKPQKDLVLPEETL